MTPEEAAQAHLSLYMQVGQGPHKKIQFTKNGITFIIENPRLIGEKGVGVSVTASTVHGNLPVDDYYQFFNPPTAIIITPAVYDQDGDEITPAALQHNVLEAAKQMVYDAVTRHAERLGWTP